jgi:rSAM/selenodomain-associated transferase 2
VGEALSISIVIPVLDEAAVLGAALEALAGARASGAEVIVADGGSRDGSERIAAAQGCRVVVAPRGRASQMNAGARAAGGDVLLFLHADTRLPSDALDAIRAAVGRGKAWGRFDVAIDGPGALLAVVGFMMNLRSRSTGIATGDQALFVRRDAFEGVGGFPAIPLMEDVAISRALKRVGKPACLRERVVTSGRRWERHGTLRTVLLMWRLRLAFALGADPGALARAYEARRDPA